jgi:hypothetical protein
MVKAWASGTIVSAADTQRWEDGVADALNAASRTKHAPSIGEFYPEAEGAGRLMGVPHPDRLTMTKEQ